MPQMRQINERGFSEMKKNKMMRIASILMVATLITTCAISGTFAKYVTKASGEDKARVAKWGIVLDVQATGAFDDRYVTHDADYEGEFSVMAYNATDEVKGDNVDIIYSTFDETPERHKRVAEMVVERAKRLVEQKQDVVILLDSLTRLTRAYNLICAPSGRTLSGGIDPAPGPGDSGGSPSGDL